MTKAHEDDAGPAPPPDATGQPANKAALSVQTDGNTDDDAPVLTRWQKGAATRKLNQMRKAAAIQAGIQDATTGDADIAAAGVKPTRKTRGSSGVVPPLPAEGSANSLEKARGPTTSNDAPPVHTVPDTLVASALSIKPLPPRDPVAPPGPVAPPVPTAPDTLVAPDLPVKPPPPRGPVAPPGPVTPVSIATPAAASPKKSKPGPLSAADDVLFRAWAKETEDFVKSFAERTGKSTRYLWNRMAMTVKEAREVSLWNLWTHRWSLENSREADAGETVSQFLKRRSKEYHDKTDPMSDDEKDAYKEELCGWAERYDKEVADGIVDKGELFKVMNRVCEQFEELGHPLYTHYNIAAFGFIICLDSTDAAGVASNGCWANIDAIKNFLTERRVHVRSLGNDVCNLLGVKRLHEAEMKDWSPQAFDDWTHLDQGKKRDKLKEAYNHLQYTLMGAQSPSITEYVKMELRAFDRKKCMINWPPGVALPSVGRDKYLGDQMRTLVEEFYRTFYAMDHPDEPGSSDETLLRFVDLTEDELKLEYDDRVAWYKVPIWKTSDGKVVLRVEDFVGAKKGKTIAALREDAKKKAKDEAKLEDIKPKKRDKKYVEVDDEDDQAGSGDDPSVGTEAKDVETEAKYTHPASGGRAKSRQRKKAEQADDEAREHPAVDTKLKKGKRGRAAVEEGEQPAPLVTGGAKKQGSQSRAETKRQKVQDVEPAVRRTRGATTSATSSTGKARRHNAVGGGDDADARAMPEDAQSPPGNAGRCNAVIPANARAMQENAQSPSGNGLTTSTTISDAMQGVVETGTADWSLLAPIASGLSHGNAHLYGAQGQLALMGGQQTLVGEQFATGQQPPFAMGQSPFGLGSQFVGMPQLGQFPLPQFLGVDFNMQQFPSVGAQQFSGGAQSSSLTGVDFSGDRQRLAGGQDGGQ